MLTPDSANALFQYLVKEGSIEFRYPQEGCNDRAHMMARLLKSTGLCTYKIWSFCPELSGQKSKELITVPDPNNLSSRKISWRYHVAPVVLVFKASTVGEIQLDTMVLDPSLFSKPVVYTDWLNAQSPANIGFLFRKSKWYNFSTAADGKLGTNWWTDGDDGGNPGAISKGWIRTSLCKGRTIYRYIEYEIKPAEEKLAKMKADLASGTQVSSPENQARDIKLLEQIIASRKATARQAQGNQRQVDFGSLGAFYIAYYNDLVEDMSPKLTRVC